jgi:subtilisin family serine protease
VRVAVIDTGIDARHPVLSKSIAMSFDAVGDGKKTVDRHGTAIAGLIAGQGKVKGVAPLSRLLAVRAFTMHREYNKPMTSGLILLRSFDWSFANKARIFNMSFSGPYDPLVKKALESAYEKGVILVAAAGNGGAKAAPAYPAAYENVIAITALDNKDKLYVHANRGEYVTVAAPGVDMLVPSIKKGYRYSSGTSLAAAQISGLIALLLEKNPDATSEAIVDAIKNSARDLGPKGYDTQFGAGLADAHASLLSLNSSQ